MGFLQKLFSGFLLLSALLFATNCQTPQSNIEAINEPFEKKYGKEVEKINFSRTPTKQQDKEVTYSTAPTVEEVNESIAAKPGYYPYVDVSKFTQEKPVQTYMPDADTYESAASRNPSNAIPPNIFEVSYNTNLHPPFRRIGAEFDTINVPPQDAYGVKTAMSEKPYLLVGNDALQKSIDHINNDKTEMDVEISETLIREQKQMKRKAKMIKTFGEEGGIELASLEKNNEKKEEKIAAPKEENKKLEFNADTISAQGIKDAVTGIVSNMAKN